MGGAIIILIWYDYNYMYFVEGMITYTVYCIIEGMITCTCIIEGMITCTCIIEGMITCTCIIDYIICFRLVW